MTKWKVINDLYGIAKNNYSQKDKPHRLELDVGDAVIIKQETDHWYYGYKKKDRNIMGIFPKNYIHIMENVYLKEDIVTGERDLEVKRSDTIEEITTVLKEWSLIFKDFYLKTHPDFKKILIKILELIKLRANLLSDNLPVDEIKQNKLRATEEIDTGNKLLGLDMVVRDDQGDILDINNTSTTKLYEHHNKAEERIKKSLSLQGKNISTRTMNKQSHNILLNVHAFVCKYQEDTDLLFTLYDAEENKAITENYVVKWSRQGLSRDLDNLDNHHVLFTDLSSQDLNRIKIHLICYAIRIGAMDGKEVENRRSSVLQGQTNKPNSINGTGREPTNENLRRPFGVGAIDLTPIIRKPDEFKNNLDLNFILCEKDTLDNTLKKLLVNKDVKNESKIAVSVEVLHGDVKQIKEEFPHMVHGNLAFARKMGFPEVILPGDVRNDLYLTLVQAEFSRGGKASERNIEASVTVCNENGQIVPNVITIGAGVDMMSEYKSVIYYHDDKPKWNETFKIQVPIEEFKRCHLKFMFKHRSSNEVKDRAEKPFALAYVKLLQEDGTTLHHKIHQLIVYKIDYKKYSDETQYNYLTLPSLLTELNKNTKPSISGFTYLPKDVFMIETNLCSTKLTQDIDLLGLLNWSSNTNALELTLAALVNVNAEEVVKFLPDILDALFNIMGSGEYKKHDELVFRCLLKLIEIVSDLKYQHFQSVLDLYINESFSATLAYDNLITVLQVQIRNAINHRLNDFEEFENVSKKTLYKTMKHLQYIIKFIIKSRILYVNLNGDKDKHVFEDQLENLLELFYTLMISQNNMLLSQGAVLKCLHIVASDLTQVYDAVKLSKRIVRIFTEMNPGSLTQSKMICIRELVNSKLFRLPECRAVLLPIFCQQIKEKLECKEEGEIVNDLWQHEKNIVKAAKILGEDTKTIHARETTEKTKIAECVNIMNSVLQLLFRGDIGSVLDDIHVIVNILLRTVIQTSIAMDRDNPLVGNLVAVMLGIFRLMLPVHYDEYVNKFATDTDLQDFITEILLVFKDLVSKSVFLNDWMDMIMHQNSVILESLRNFSGIIMEHFLNPFEKQVWSNYFHCSIAFLIQPALQLDKFSHNKKSTMLSRYRDIRLQTVEEISKMWYSLGEFKTYFVPSLVGNILEMSLIPEVEIRRISIPIFFDMMQCECNTSKYMIESYGDTRRNNSHCKGHFRDFEKEMIEKLDILVEGGKGDEQYKNLFYEIMIELCKTHILLQHEGTKFVVMVKKLLERLLEYRCIINDESKENRMACTVSLLQFYEEVNRQEMYIRYVNKLCDLHREFDNFTEAAFTLKLHANLLKWEDISLSNLLRSHRYPHCQTHRALKITLYYEIIDLFDKGKMYEDAIEICKELAHQYEYEIYDYKRLSEIHSKLCDLYKNILTVVRPESEYFRVGFYGLKFPEFLRNKVFIYRGKEYERLIEFSARISGQYPAAELLTTLSAPGPDITQSDGQYLQINSVEPIMDCSYRKLNEKVIPVQIVRYYQTNNVQNFKFSQRLRDPNKEVKNDDNVSNVWLERTQMKTKLPLPGILRWFQVEKTEIFTISPIEHAIETIETKNRNLRDLIIAHKNDASLAIQSLLMITQGIVDAAVNGGLTKYEEAFLADEYIIENPDNIKDVDRLKEAIASQIPLLKIAVRILNDKAPNDLMPLLERVEKCFNEMQDNVESKFGKRVTDLKFERESYVELRRNLSTSASFDASNRLSETSVGSADSSGGSNRLFSVRSQTAIKSTFSSLTNFNTRSSTMNSPNSKGKQNKTNTNTKRRSGRKFDRETLNITPTASNGTQWYTSPSPLSTIDSPPFDSTGNTSINSSNAVVELTEELTPKRPLRSEVEKERRLSRTASSATPTASLKNYSITTNGGTNQNSTDNNSLSGESSNRNSIVTTDSTNSEDDIPPPLPVKARDSNDYSNLPTHEIMRNGARNMVVTARPLPPNPVSNYEYLEVKIDDKRRPPTPPPKPSRNSKIIPNEM